MARSAVRRATVRDAGGRVWGRKHRPSVPEGLVRVTVTLALTVALTLTPTLTLALTVPSRSHKNRPPEFDPRIDARKNCSNPSPNPNPNLKRLGRVSVVVPSRSHNTVNQSSIPGSFDPRIFRSPDLTLEKNTITRALTLTTAAVACILLVVGLSTCNSSYNSTVAAGILMETAFIRPFQSVYW